MDDKKTRVALISIIIEDRSCVPKINAYLHEFADFVIGRMGLPYQKRNVSIISVAVDAPEDKISALSGKLGALSGASTKTVYSKI